MSKDSEGIHFNYGDEDKTGPRPWVRRPPWEVDEDVNALIPEAQQTQEIPVGQGATGAPDETVPFDAKPAVEQETPGDDGKASWLSKLTSLASVGATKNGGLNEGLPHYREADATQEPRARRPLGCVIPAVIVAVLALCLLVWHFADGGESSSTTGGTPESSSTQKANPTDVQNALTYERLGYEGPRKNQCKLDADPTLCNQINSVEGPAPAGLSRPLKVLKTTTLPGSTPNEGAAVPSDGTPPTLIVLIEVHPKNLSTTQYRVLAVRTSDHKVLATDGLSSQERAKSLEEIGQKLVADATSDDGDGS